MNLKYGFRELSLHSESFQHYSHNQKCVNNPCIHKHIFHKDVIRSFNETLFSFIEEKIWHMIQHWYYLMTGYYMKRSIYRKVKYCKALGRWVTVIQINKNKVGCEGLWERGNKKFCLIMGWGRLCWAMWAAQSSYICLHSVNVLSTIQLFV